MPSGMGTIHWRKRCARSMQSGFKVFARRLPRMLQKLSVALLLSARVSQTDWSKQGSWWMESCLPGKSSEPPRVSFSPWCKAHVWDEFSLPRSKGSYVHASMLTAKSQWSKCHFEGHNEDPTASLRPRRVETLPSSKPERCYVSRLGEHLPGPRTLLR